MPNLDAVLLSYPTVLDLKDDAKRSWIQVARTGNFHSRRYGKFSIEKSDLASMARNFREVFPQHPTQIPVDYDHLSTNVKQVGDGVAAGWFRHLQLRGNGDELWAEIEWTPEGARRIANQEYKFFSPTFARDYIYKNGKNIGTTLLAGALTCHPFLEGMASVTLASSAFAEAVRCDIAGCDALPASAVQLSEIGQHVGLSDDPELTPELTDDERGRSYVITAVAGVGDNEFLRLKDINGRASGWYRINQIVPARAASVDMAGSLGGIVDNAKIAADAARFRKKVVELADTGKLGAAEALLQAAVADPVGAEAWRLEGLGVDVDDAPEPTAVLHLSSPPQPSETFESVCARYSVEHGVSLKTAVHEVGKAMPNLAAAH